MNPFIALTTALFKILSITITYFVFSHALLPELNTQSFNIDGFLKGLVVSAVPIIICAYSFTLLPKHLKLWIEQSSEELDSWINKAGAKQLITGVVLLAGLTLFLELALIRWLSSLFPIFALYKNFILLACFCGIGIGYSLADRKLLLAASLPILSLGIILLLVFRHSSDPILLMMVQTITVNQHGHYPLLLSLELLRQDESFRILMSVFAIAFLSIAFILNALMLIPIAQLCGRFMDQVKHPLNAYGANLLGSILGLIILFFLSWLWTGPLIWFGLCVGIMLFYQFKSFSTHTIGLLFGFGLLLAFAWPASNAVKDIHSPYQLIQTATKHEDGTLWFLASGSYHQEIDDMSSVDPNNILDVRNKGFWELPYRLSENKNSVMIIGGGIGNDASAALRSGFKEIDAVEIDPAIIEIGKVAHPEKPYDNPAVNVIITDARGYLTHTDKTYDVISYGSQDTTILLSQGESVRFDTFVFTKEAIEIAYSRLNDGGIIAMWLQTSGDNHIGHKIFTIMKNLENAGSPKVIGACTPDQNGNCNRLFVVRKNAEIVLPLEFMEEHIQQDITENYETLSDTEVEIPTDNWPFFLMSERKIPLNYILSLLLVLGLSFFMIHKLLPQYTLNTSLLPFFFLGAGFMLIETKTITEMALTFSNTWHVIAITIICLLSMAYLANLFVASTKKNVSMIAFALLFISIIVGYFSIINGGLNMGGFAGKAASVIILTIPMLFSGIIFSTLFKRTNDITGAMAYNIMGAMVGGLIEYSSMKFGFSSLYFIALAIYIMAFLTSLRLAK